MKSKLLAVVFCVLVANSTMGDSSRFSNDILKQTFGYNENSKRIVDLTELHQGCRAKDCIPSIDNPVYGTVADNTLLQDSDVVMLVKYNGIRKGYPLKIMQGHEIVNDTFKGKHLAVTYCPLCASAVAFVPKVAGEYVEFGVSGLLHNSDLVLYDRKTHSLWGQITGQAIVGPQTGKRLKRVYVAQITWAQVKKHFPDLMVLQPPKGSKQNYRRNYYERYYKDEQTMFPVGAKDGRLNQKVKVHGFIIDDQAVAVEVEYLADKKALEQTINNRPIAIELKSNGTITVSDSKSGETFVPMITFWFAWFNFHPDTLLIKG